MNQVGRRQHEPAADRDRQRPLRRRDDAARAPREREHGRRERPLAAVCRDRSAQPAVVAGPGARAAAGRAPGDDQAAARRRRGSEGHDHGQGEAPRLVRHALDRPQGRHAVPACGLERRHRGHEAAARARRRSERRDREERDRVAAAVRRGLAARPRLHPLATPRSKRRSICWSRSSAKTSTPRRAKASRR